MKTYETPKSTISYCKEVELTIKKRSNGFEKKAITSSHDAAQYIKQFYHDDIDIYESFFMIMLDKKNKTKAYAKIAQGGLSSVLVDGRIICKYAIDSLAQGVIIAHNHPSGSLLPSKEDVNLTKKVQKMLDVLDVRLLEHIIVTSESYYSFSDNGGL